MAWWREFRSERTDLAPQKGIPGQPPFPMGSQPQLPQNLTTSFLTATTLIYAIGAGITAGAGTRLVLQLLLANGFGLCPFRTPYHKGMASVRVVTTSLNQDWVICAPAAFLGCGSHLSGSLSGIEP